jgi:hypothetical protein
LLAKQFCVISIAEPNSEMQWHLMY